MKRALYVLVIGSVISILSFVLVYVRTDGFNISAISGDIGYDKSWDVTLNENEFDNISKILDQEFYYYERGRQNFVFKSEDGNYVLKLINHDRFRYPSLFYTIPLPGVFDNIRNVKIQKKEKRPKAFFDSYLMAFDKMKDETGLLYIHLNYSDTFNKTITIYDKLGQPHELQLNKTRFLLQKKGKLIFPYLQKLHKTKKEKGLKEGIDLFLDLLVKRCNRCIADDDLNVKYNIGFVDNKAIFFDVGKWYADQELQDPDSFKKEMIKSTKFFRKWIKINYPHMKTYLDNEIKKRVELNFISNKSSFVEFQR